MRVFGAKELVDDVQNNSLCIGCGACVNLCPYFRNHRGTTVQLFTCNLAQGRCHASCPKAEVNLEELAGLYWGQPYQGAPIGKYDESLAAKAGAEMVSGAYQAGGTVSALLVQAMNQGLIEAAVLTGQDKGVPCPMLAESPAEIIDCALLQVRRRPTRWQP